MADEKDNLGAVRVRIAPSPSGYMHIGNARTALFNWLFARGRGGRFIFRIDDTDQARSSEASIQGIIEGMEWLGLDWDEGPRVGGPFAPYFQSERKAIYAGVLQDLMAKGLAYECYCPNEELEAERERARLQKRPLVYSGRCRHLTEEQRQGFRAAGRRPAIRLRVEPGTITISDVIRGVVSVEADTLGDFVICRSNGGVIYNFASVVDDVLMKITHIIRAEEHLANTPKQVRLFEAMGAPLPVFAHVPLVLAEGSREKLSKRHGAVAVQDFRDAGYLPEAVVNYLARLGWSYDDKREVFSLEELKRLFSLERVNPHAASWDSKKLLWLNDEYLRRLTPRERAERCVPFLQKAGLLPAAVEAGTLDYVERVILAIGDRLKTFASVLDYGAFFFTEEYPYDPAGAKRWLSDPRTGEVLRRLKDALAAAEPFTLETTEAAVRAVADSLGLKAGQVINPLRVALSGKTVGPGMFEIVVLLGRERTLGRLDRTARFLAEGADGES